MWHPHCGSYTDVGGARKRACLVYVTVIVYVCAVACGVIFGLLPTGEEENGTPVVIGIIDTGISTNAIPGENILPGKNYVDPARSTEDTYGHGTAVASVILEQLRAITAEEQAILDGHTDIDRSLYMQGQDNTINAKKLLAAGIFS